MTDMQVKSLKKHIEDEDNLKEFEEDLSAPDESADESETKEKKMKTFKQHISEDSAKTWLL